ncbi:MAG TPA: diacylglycerol kinase family protein, partial [Streptosporangiaceae bacterium]
EPSFLETTLDDRGVGLARAAVADGARMVVAAGGDGTVRACAQALAGTQVPLAIVPLGTANLAARALGIPAGAGRSFAAAFGGQERRIDLAVAEAPAADAAVTATGGAGRLTFAAMAGIGLDAEVVAATPRLLKRRVGWLAYAAAGVAHLPGRGERFTVRLDDGEPLARRARCVVVGNAGLLPGGFTLLPQARLDDGLLDVGILAPAGPAGWLRVAHRVLTGSDRDGRALERHQARRVEISAETELPREVDGEVITPGRSLTVTLLRSALTVRVPPRGRRPGPLV